MALFDDSNDVEYNGISLVQISKIFVTQDNFFNRAAPFDGVHKIFASIYKPPN